MNKVKRVYGDPQAFRGGVYLGSCYRDEMGFVKVMACVNTPDGVHCFHLTEHEWALLHKEVKEAFEDGPEPEAEGAREMLA